MPWSWGPPWDVRGGETFWLARSVQHYLSKAPSKKLTGDESLQPLPALSWRHGCVPHTPGCAGRTGRWGFVQVQLSMSQQPLTDVITPRKFLCNPA